MSVYRPKNSSFYHFDFQLRGRRFHGSTGQRRRRDAEEIERQERERAKQFVKELAAQRDRPETFDLAAGHYWRDKGSRHVNAKDTERYLERLVKALGTKLLTEITSADVAELVARRRDEGVKPATVNRSVTEMLRKVLRYAATRGQIVPQIKWRDHLLPEPQERVRELSEFEEGALDEAIRPDFLPVFHFAVLVGVRLSEAVKLTWSDVDWGARTIRVRGKGNKVRPVPITSEVHELLWPLCAHHPTAVFTYVAARNLPKRGIEKGKRYPLTVSGLQARWHRDRALSSVKDFRWHDLRHTTATRVLRNGGNLRIVQKLLGHQRIETTARYAHVQIEDIAEALERVTDSRTASRTDSAADVARSRKRAWSTLW